MYLRFAENKKKQKKDFSCSIRRFSFFKHVKLFAHRIVSELKRNEVKLRKKLEIKIQ